MKDTIFDMSEENLDPKTKFSYNGGVLMFDIYSESDKDPTELAKKVKHLIGDTTSEELLPGISAFLDDIEEADEWKDVKKMKTYQPETLKKTVKELENHFEQISNYYDYYLRFVAYTCFEIIKDREGMGKYLKEFEEEMPKYFPKKVVISMKSTLNAITKLIEAAPEETMKKKLGENLKKVESLE